MIPIEEAYSGRCIFCGAHAHYRVKRDDGMKHQVCKACANSSRTIECADERYAIIDEPYPVDGKGNSIPRKGEPGYKKGSGTDGAIFRAAIEEEIMRQEAVAESLKGAEQVVLSLTDSDGRSFKGRFTGKFLVDDVNGEL